MLLDLHVSVSLRDLAILALALQKRGASSRTLSRKRYVISWAMHLLAKQFVAEGIAAPERDIDALAVLTELGLFSKSRKRTLPLSDYHRLKEQAERNPMYLATTPSSEQ